MTKDEALHLFGGRLADLGNALGITAQAVHQWPEELTYRQEIQVIGAAVKRGIWTLGPPEAAPDCRRREFKAGAS